MFCTSCGNEINNAAVICPNCGVPVKGRNIAATADIPNHLVSAIVLAFFCFIPGVIAIIYSCQVNTKLAAGDYEGALKASRCAKGWVTWGTIAVVACILLAVIGKCLEA